MGITKAEKRFRTPSVTRPQNSRAAPNVPGQYQTLLERWKRNEILGHSEMVRYVMKGSNGFNNGWAISRNNIDNVASNL